MKRIPLILAALSLAGFAAVVSCHKTNNVATPINTNQVFSSLRSSAQTLSVTAGMDTTVYAANGTMLHFYANSFKSSTGNIITSGPISIKIIEMYNPGDMALNRATTTADAGQLSSGGQVSILAYQGTQQVTANKYGIGFRQSGASGQNMQLFYGTTNNTDSIATWTISDTTKTGTTASGTVADSSGGGTGSGVNFMYVFDSCTNFGWINCDHYMGSSYTLTSISLSVPDNSFSSDNTEVFLMFPSDKSVMSLYYDGSSKTYKSGFGGMNTVPVGLNYEIVLVTNKKESYYYWSGSGTVTTSMSVTAAPASETLADIITRMHAL